MALRLDAEEKVEAAGAATHRRAADLGAVSQKLGAGVPSSADRMPTLLMQLVAEK